VRYAGPAGWWCEERWDDTDRSFVLLTLPPVPAPPSR
jgi:hypothetical protein